MQLPRAAAWPHISKIVLSPSHPFPVHEHLLKLVFEDWQTDRHGPAPLYWPTPQTAACTNAARFMQQHPELLQLPACSERNDAIARCAARALALSQSNVQLLQQWERLHAASVHHPEHFWPRFLDVIGFAFSTQPERVLQLGSGSNPDDCVWFPGARCNIAAAALQGRLHDPDAVALVAACEAEPHRYA